MNERMKRVAFWLPRGLALLFAAFISLFALDVFGQGTGVWDTIVALFMHLMPTFPVLAALAVAWRRAWARAVLFTSLAVAYRITTWGRTEGATVLIVAGPALLVGILFLVDWLVGADPRPGGVERAE